MQPTTGYGVGTDVITTSDSAALPIANVVFTGASSMTVSVTLVTLGPQTLTATDTINPAMYTATTGTTVITGTTQFVINDFPTPDDVAGVPSMFTVTAEDADGNVTPGYAGTVRHFTSSDTAPGVIAIPADATFWDGKTGILADDPLRRNRVSRRPGCRR